MIHRYFAGALGLVILAIAAQAVRRRGQPGQPVKLPLLLLAVVIAQAIFGMWTVTLQLWPQVVTAHLLGGFTTLSLLFLLCLRLRSEEHTSELQSLMRISYAVFCLKKKKNNNKHKQH